MDQITQAEIVEFARLKKESETASKALETCRQDLVDRHNAGATQESGSFRLSIETTTVNSPSYKDAVEEIRKLNATYINGNGKPHLLNDKIPGILEAVATLRPRTTVKVEANV
jgi:hypothetical protein